MGARGGIFFVQPSHSSLYGEGGGGGIITRRLERCSTLSSIAALGPIKPSHSSLYGEGGAGIKTRRLKRCSTLSSISALGPIKSTYKEEG